MQGMDSMSAVTVTVTMTKTDESKGIGNYNLLEADKLSQVSSNFLSQSEYTSCTPDTAGKIVWLNFDTNVTSNGLSIRAYQANTVYDGMSVSITLQRNSGNVTAEDYATFTEIVSSVSFIKESAIGSMIPYIIIGASIAVILLLIILIIVVKHAKKRRKRTRMIKFLRSLQASTPQNAETVLLRSRRNTAFTRTRIKKKIKTVILISAQNTTVKMTTHLTKPRLIPRISSGR